MSNAVKVQAAATKTALAHALRERVETMPAKLKSASEAFNNKDPLVRQRAATDALKAVSDCLTGLGYPRQVLAPLEGLWTALCDHAAGIRNPLLDVAEYDASAPRRPHGQARVKVEVAVAITLLREAGLSLSDAAAAAANASGEEAKALISYRKNLRRGRAVSDGERESYNTLLPIARALSAGDQRSLRGIAERLLRGLHLVQ
jgi:hypothetical protein